MCLIEAPDVLRNFKNCNKNAICEIIPINNKKIIVKWFYFNLTYSIVIKEWDVYTYSIKAQRAMHQARLIMKIRTNLRKMKSKHKEFKINLLKGG